MYDSLYDSLVTAYLALRRRQEPPVTPEAAEVVVGDGLDDVPGGQVPDLDTGGGAQSEEAGGVEQQRGGEPWRHIDIREIQRQREIETETKTETGGEPWGHIDIREIQRQREIERDRER